MSYVMKKSYDISIIVCCYGGEETIEGCLNSLKYQKREKEMSKIWGSINSYSLIAIVIAITTGGYLARSHDPNTFVLLIWLFTFGAIIAFIISLFVTERKHQKKIKEVSPLILFKESTVPHGRPFEI